jgi:hypothetical protein
METMYVTARISCTVDGTVKLSLVVWVHHSIAEMHEDTIRHLVGLLRRKDETIRRLDAVIGNMRERSLEQAAGEPGAKRFKR